MRRILKPEQIFALYAVFMLAVLLIAGTVRAGNLNPHGQLSPLMEKLDQIPPSWSQKLPTAERFEVVLDGSAVLDKETGLVWEKSPSDTPMLWSNAIDSCRFKEVGGRMGWRMPRLEELQSLVDKTRNNPSLPAGYPFGNVQTSKYWSISLFINYSWYVDFSNGSGGGMDICDYAYVWCVRGGNNPDYQFEQPPCSN
jgi:hypothetical protein